MGNMVKPYLDYLDKEMTIMGILSAFCAGAAGLIAKQAFPVASSGRLFFSGRPDIYYISSGLALLLVAAFFFYWQRSHLAWLYGQLSLWTTDQATSGQTLEALLLQSDTWRGWIPYQVGLVLTVGSFAEFAGVLLPLAPDWETHLVLSVALSTLSIATTIALVRIRRDRIETEEPKRQSRRRLRADRGKA